jgi:acyl-CoA synthetase (AMP-forming)/AMP-acid ligase II
VAVVGVPDERMGEVGRAFVVAVVGVPTADLGAELTDLARAELANFKAPRSVVVVDSLPTNASGKVLKRELRDRSTDPATA